MLIKNLKQIKIIFKNKIQAGIQDKRTLKLDLFFLLLREEKIQLSILKCQWCFLFVPLAIKVLNKIEHTPPSLPVSQIDREYLQQTFLYCKLSITGNKHKNRKERDVAVRGSWPSPSLFNQEII